MKKVAFLDVFERLEQNYLFFVDLVHEQTRHQRVVAVFVGGLSAHQGFQISQTLIKLFLVVDLFLLECLYDMFGIFLRDAFFLLPLLLL